MHEHISVADGFERLAWKQAVLGLGLLKAKDLRGPFRDQPPYIVQPEANRVDVPGDEAHNHGASEQFGWDRTVEEYHKNIGARSGGKTGRLHVRSVWGKLDPQGRRVRFNEGLPPSPLPKQADGVGQKESKAAIRACPQGKIACGARELVRSGSCRADGGDG